MLANWVRQATITTGNVLSIALTEIAGRPEFLDTHAADAPVKYAILSGNGVSREEGTGVIRAGGILERTTPSVTWDGTTYDRTPTPARIVLSGTSIVYITTGELDIVTADNAVTLTNKVINDPSNLVHADAVHVATRNVSGTTMPLGTVIYISGYNAGQDKTEIDLADADDPAAMPAFGIVDEQMLNNANGQVNTHGQMGGMDTSAWAVGDTLYVSTTPGELTNIKPTDLTEQIQSVARVERSHASAGRIFIFGSGRANDIPNNLGDAFADSLTINAAGAITLPITATPSLAWSDGDTGFYESSDDNLRLNVGGILTWIWDTNELQGAIHAGSPRLRNVNSSAAIPSYTFRDDNDTGMYWVSADILGFSAGGIDGIRITESLGAININLYGDTNLPFINDSITPVLNFGDGDTGFYEAADDNFRIVIAGGARVYMTTSAIQFGSGGANGYIPWAVPTATIPAFTFANDANTGIGTAGADQLSLIAGGLEGIRITETAAAITISMNGDTNFPFNNDAATPTINFGDGNTGFYESADNWLAVSTAGISRWVFQSEFFQSNRANFGAALYANASSLTFPAHTFLGDTNTGVHRPGDDQVSLVAGAIEGLRVSETGSVITINFEGITVYPKASGSGIKVDTTTPTFGWADILGDQFSKNTGATKPSLAVYNGVINAWQFAVGNEVYITYHIPHDYVKGSDIFLHIHWSHTGTLVTGGTVTFKATSIYAKSHNQAAFGTPAVGTFNANASTTQYQHILSEIQYSDPAPAGLEIDTDLLEPDGVIELTLELDVNSITVSGGGVPEPFIHFVDVHYQSTGLIGTKDKAPDFYA